MVAQAEIWLMETPNQKRRPVLIVSRNEVIPFLNNVVVAPVTSTIRSIPTCIPDGPD
ncbi:MAG: type II toxin-antitoxin system PemK/MazF family toxin, partial [Actinomycetota bacterium]